MTSTGRMTHVRLLPRVRLAAWLRSSAALAVSVEDVSEQDLARDQLLASRGNRDLTPVPHSQLDGASCPRRGRVAAGLQEQLDDACASFNWRLDSE